MINKIKFVFLLLSTVSISSFGQHTSKISSAKNDVDKTALNKKIDSLFSFIKNTHSPGCAVIVTQHGNVIAQKNYGMSSLEHAVPFTQQSVVRIPYSEGREFIAVAAMLMEQAGILQLTDKVRGYFPRLPDWSENVTILDLLNHRSGFVDEWANLLLMHASMGNRFDVSQFLNLLYQQPLPQIEPGKGYMYCNSDFGLLRLIMEKASGKSLPNWMKLNMFDPLKMQATRMQQNPLTVIPNYAPMYASEGDNNFLLNRIQKTSPGGNYYILTTAADLVKWLAAQNDSATPIAKATVALLKNVRMMPGKSDHYIFGQSYTNTGGRQVVLHEGVSEWVYASSIPAKGITVITLGNNRSGFGLENDFIVKYLLQQTVPARLKFNVKQVAVSKQELSEYTGHYLWDEQLSWQSAVKGRKFSRFFIEGDVLKADFNRTVIDLVPTGKDTFYHKEDGLVAQVVFSSSSTVAPMKVAIKYDDGYPGVAMTRDTSAVWQPSKDELKSFAGKYYSRHLDFYWTIVINEEGKLIIKRPTIADTVIEPDGPNQFHFKMEDHAGSGFDAWVLFHKNVNNTVSHLTVWYPRLMHHRFDKQ